uniref:type IV conjugative transfer system lipoprotein TraV n=1 Tax=Escherichia coli TaxID=562 RepID=UPI00092D6B13
MNILYLTPVALALLLSGCAGMKSEFDCNAIASNSCMTMDEANNKARSATERSEATKQPSLPRLADSGSQPLTRTVPFAVKTPAGVPDSVALPASSRASGNTATGSRIVPDGDSTRQKSRRAAQEPVRLQATTARMWIAA